MTPPSNLGRSARLAAGAGLAAVLLAVAGAAWGWGASGHRFIGQAAMLALPADLPAFLRTRAAVQDVGELSREPDRSKGGGRPHDGDLDPGHFVDLTEDGHVFTAAGPSIDALPVDRSAYSTELVKADISLFKAGWLPYDLMDGYQQLVRDFALWRAAGALAKSSKNPRERAWYTQDQALRERLTLRDLGYWAHFVGDASQPLHVSIHYNGWGKDYPNPKGYTLEPIHGPFEEAYVYSNVTLKSVQAAMPAPADCGATIQLCTSGYLKRTLAEVEPLYDLYKAGAFARPGEPRAKAFATTRVAAAAAMLRDLVVRAWRESGEAEVGYRPAYKVRDIENGQVIPFAVLYGEGPVG